MSHAQIHQNNSTKSLCTAVNGWDFEEETPGIPVRSASEVAGNGIDVLGGFNLGYKPL